MAFDQPHLFINTSRHGAERILAGVLMQKSEDDASIVLQHGA
jgi:hypothetical protein